MVSFILAGCWFVSATVAGQEASKMDRFIDELMSRMTLQEKIGQLNLPVSGNIVTGEAKSSDIAAKIARGEVEYPYPARDCRRKKPFEDTASLWNGCDSRL